MMNPEAKAAWTTALRSGEYEQGLAALNLGGKFCCLGVLCDIAVKQFDLNIEVKEYPVGCGDDECCDPDGPTEVLYDGEGAFLPESVRRWAGLATKGGMLTDGVEAPNGETVYSLYIANDQGMSFSDIADLIEEEF